MGLIEFTAKLEVMGIKWEAGERVVRTRFTGDAV
jgi:hypothetical protein